MVETLLAGESRVALARRIHEQLAEIPGTGNGAADVMLLIGRSRSVERDVIARRLDAFRTSTSGSVRANAKPLFIVATQCLEVGVDLDLDGLVTQAASLDAHRRYAEPETRLRSIVKAGKDHVLLIDVEPADRTAFVVGSIGKTFAGVEQRAIVIGPTVPKLQKWPNLRTSLND